MSATVFLCLIAGLAVVWSSLWVYMLSSVLSDDLEQVKEQLTELKVEFHRYKMDNPPSD